MSNQCIDFLDTFCSEISRESCNEISSIPFDIVKVLLTKDEIEGQCVDWVLTFLCKRNCPSSLAAVIAQLSVEKLQPAIQKLLEQQPSGEGHETEDSKSGCIASDVLRGMAYREVVDVCHSFDRQKTSILDRLVDPQTSVHAVKNTRRKMEDKHVLLSHFGLLFNKSSKYLSYYAVFDGHGGVEAAQYASTHVHCVLARHLQTLGNVHDALRQTFLDTDQMFIDHAVQERLSSGSTAVCALVENSKLHIAWLGDSQALLVRDGCPIQLMTPHKPEREDERKRIEDLGGCVMYIGTWRVNGTLSVSRAIGDVHSKPFVSGEPDVVTVDYKPGDWLILACDGLWDEVTYDDVATLVRDGDSTTIAHRLIQLAKERGSSDNITVLAVCLGQSASVCEDVISTIGSNQTKDDSHNEYDHQDDDSYQDKSDSNQHAARSDVSYDRVNSSTESSRLALSVKRSAERSLDYSDDENYTESHALKADSQLNISPPSRSDDASSQATSDDVSKKSVDLSNETTGLSSIESCTRRRSRRKPSHDMMPMKENRWPSVDTAGTTPPCIHHASPPPYEESVVHSKSCRSLSWVSTAPLFAMVQRGSTSSGCPLKSPVEPSRSRVPHASNRWTIAVEVDADVGMFNSDFPESYVKIPSMNLSTHW